MLTIKAEMKQQVSLLSRFHVPYLCLYQKLLKRGRGSITAADDQTNACSRAARLGIGTAGLLHAFHYIGSSRTLSLIVGFSFLVVVVDLGAF